MDLDAVQKRALLRRFEPVIRFTRGERFFPMDAETYIRACSLWIKRPKEEPRLLVPANELTPERLAEPYADEFGTVRYLQFTEPLKATEMAAQALRRRKIEHHAASFRAGTGRLARVGYTSRVVDALFSVSLLARGRVPGDAASAASQAYQYLLLQDDRHLYHGRVYKEGNWVVLQYWFFYLYNNWRSAFNGANDHEADWEMVCIYLAPDAGGELRPEWVACASHDYIGDDLRRRWDDPELQKEGEHPILFAGAGSHASYFSQGEYLTEIELNLLAPVTRVLGVARHWWRNLEAEAADADDAGRALRRPPDNTLWIPFVDYARGDGWSIGPGQDEAWSEPCLIDEQVGWVRYYRGLWGLYTRDPFAGEDAPAGPMFNRDGSVRRAWYDPVGWAGLDKVPPSAQLADTIERERQALLARQELLRHQVQEKVVELRSLGVKAAATRNQPHLQQSHAAIQQQIELHSREADRMWATIAADDAMIESLTRYGEEVADGNPGDLRDHIRRPHTPAPQIDAPGGRVSELWAAVSVAVLLLAFVVLFFFNPRYLPFWMVGIIAVFAFIEAGLRGTFTRIVSSFATGLAIVAGLVLLYEYFWWVAGLLVLGLAVYVLVDNLRELTR
jgi:hypothetical protein